MGETFTLINVYLAELQDIPVAACAGIGANVARENNIVGRFLS